MARASKVRPVVLGTGTCRNDDADLDASVALSVSVGSSRVYTVFSLPEPSPLWPQLPVGVAAAASSDTSTRVSVGSPRSLFSQNKQNEPGLALDACRPNVLVAGSNDEIDMEACNAGGPTSCPFTPGVGVSGSISPSIPATTGHNRPTRAGPPGIDLDRPPAPHMLGRSGPCENISRMAWPRTDNAASSPFFGNVYVCNVSFRSNGGAPESVKIHRSTIDGVAGSRTEVFPSINIANGAPSGIGAPDTIVLGWSDNRLV